MNPSWVAWVAMRWCAAYTRGIGDSGTIRREEIASDTHEHLADHPNRPGGLLLRVILGIPADLSWRHQQVRRARRARGEGQPDMHTAEKSLVGLAAAALLGAVQVLVLGLAAIVSTLRYDPVDSGYPAPTSAELTVGVVTLVAFIIMGCVGVNLLWHRKRHGALWLLSTTLLQAVALSWQPFIVAGSLALAAFYAFTYFTAKPPAPA